MTDTAGTVVLGVIAGIVAQVITLATLMFNARQTRLREERNRRWLLEDRAALASEVTKVTKAVSDSRTDMVNGHETIKAAIAENTAKTTEVGVAAQVAYKEANDVNMKIAALGLRFRKGDPPQ